MKNKFYLNEFTDFVKKNSVSTNIFVLASFIISVLVILFFNFFIDAFFNYNGADYKVGSPAKKDYILKSDLTYFNEFETAIARDVEEKLVLPVYKIDNETTMLAISKFEKFYRSILDTSNFNESRILRKELFNQYIPGLFSDDELEELLNIDLRNLLSLVSLEQKNILNRGYIGEQGASNDSGLISVHYTDEGDSSETVSAISVLKSTKVNKTINSEFYPYFSKLLDSFIEVNCFYDADQTKQNREIALNNVEPVIDVYRAGEILVKKDFIVTPEIHKKILAAEVHVKQNTLSNTLLVFGYVFLVYLSAVVLFTSGFIQKKLKESDIKLLSSITLFYTITSVLIKHFLIDSYSYLYPLVVPTILLSMLITFLLGNRVGLYHSLLMSFMIFLITDFSLYSFSITLVMSVLSTVIIHDVEKRIDLIKSSGELALIQTLFVLYLSVIGVFQSNNYILLFTVSLGSSIVYGILTLALLPLSEHLLRISTCFQLAELCDINAPLLKALKEKAPGTFAHSIAVANMAESAALHIGANALLAKAGGYYHDIGKMDQPHYFIENQKGGKNIHDDMKPTLSVAVIKSHVKLGIEKAKNNGLPEDIIGIIEQHHGKGAIAYFLEKAKKESKGATILNEDFGYPGPNPQSPEAAIVMLADSVEAAVRSFKNPSVPQLEKYVWELTLNKLKEGMLDACGLTLSDLTIIKDSFISTLLGHYHNRVIEEITGEVN